MKWKKIWKEAVEVEIYLNTLSQHLPGENEHNIAPQ
jgi:hypothetical protein